MSTVENNKRKHDDLRKMVDDACLRMTDGRGSPCSTNVANAIKDVARRAYYLGARDGMELAREKEKDNVPD